MLGAGPWIIIKAERFHLKEVLVEFFSSIYRQISLRVEEFLSVDWTGASFESWEFALGLAVLIVVVLTVRLLKREKTFRYQSGLEIFEGNAGGFLVGALKSLSRVGLALGTAFILLAIADPFVTNMTEQETIEKREVIFLFDASGSMGRSLSNTSYRNEDGDYVRGERISKAVLGRRGVMRFLSQREDEDERYSAWLFSSNVYHYQKWTDDFYEFEFKLFAAPHVIVGENRSAGARAGPNLRVWNIPGARGSTNIKRALRAIVEDIDEGGREDVKRRALIMVTDVELGFRADEDPGAELRELSNRGVVPYVVIVSASGEFNSRNQEFLDIVRNLGGRAYAVEDQENMRRIFDEIDNLEVVEETTEVQRSRVRLYPLPLFLALVLLLGSFSIGVVADGLEIP